MMKFDSNSGKIVHAHCIIGGVAHDHELHPKTPTDQDAVEAMTRQRDCITQTAADSEVHLPIATGSDQASTAPLQVTTKACSAVKKDNDWTTTSWTSSGSTRSHGTASRTFRAPRKLSTPSSVPSRHHVPSSLASEPAWKVPVLSEAACRKSGKSTPSRSSNQSWSPNS